jgi:hypothetical protein
MVKERVYGTKGTHRMVSEKEWRVIWSNSYILVNIK